MIGNPYKCSPWFSDFPRPSVFPLPPCLFVFLHFMSFEFFHYNCHNVRAIGHWLHDPLFGDCQVICLQETFFDSTSTFLILYMDTFLVGRCSGRCGGLLTAVRSAPTLTNAFFPYRLLWQNRGSWCKDRCSWHLNQHLTPQGFFCRELV